MVDNRSAGFFGIGGAFNFKSGDISGTAAKLSDEEQDENDKNKYTDQSAVLRATLNSLAMMNVANVINSNKRKPALRDEEEEIEKDLHEMMRVQKVDNPIKRH